VSPVDCIDCAAYRYECDSVEYPEFGRRSTLQAALVQERSRGECRHAEGPRGAEVPTRVGRGSDGAPGERHERTVLWTRLPGHSWTRVPCDLRYRLCKPLGSFSQVRLVLQQGQVQFLRIQNISTGRSLEKMEIDFV